MLCRIPAKSIALAMLLAIVSVPSLLRSQVAPAPNPSAASGEYYLGPEDVVQVWVYKEPDLSTTAVVRPDGKLSIPLIGELDAKGRTAVQLQDEIRQKLSTYVEQPVVTVIVKEINYPKISVLGQVRKPDQYKIRQRLTVLDAIALAGGFTDYAKKDRVVVLRNSVSPPRQFELDLKHPGPDTVQFYLQPFDTVYVE